MKRLLVLLVIMLGLWASFARGQEPGTLLKGTEELAPLFPPGIATVSQRAAFLAEFDKDSAHPYNRGTALLFNLQKPGRLRGPSNLLRRRCI